MPPSSGQVTPGFKSFIDSISSEPVESSIAYLISLLKRRQIRGSKACAIATAYLLLRVVSLTRASDPSKLLHRVQEVGKRLVEAASCELAIGNIVRRVLGLIRDEQDENRGGDESFSSTASEAGSAPPTPRFEHPSAPSVNGIILPPRDTSTPQRPSLLSSTTGSPPSARPMTSMFSILSHPTMRSTPHTNSPTPSGTHTPTPAHSSDLRAEIVEGIKELSDELTQSDDQIANYCLDHIAPSDTIFTYSSSTTVQRFLLKAASKRKFTVIQAESYPNNHKKVHACVTGNHNMDDDEEQSVDSFQKPLVAAGVTVILIPDSAIFTLLPRCSKVILSAYTVLTNGDFVGAAGTSTITKCAKLHRVPTIVLAATYKLSPEFPYEKDALVERGDVNRVVPIQDGELRRGLRQVRNVLTDFVEGGDVDLFVTNVGAVTSKGVERIGKDMYWEEDRVLVSES